MCVLFSSNPMYGHVNTMLPMADAAQRAGHDVVFATGAGMARLIESRGLTTWRTGPETAPSGASADWMEYFLSAATERATTLVPRATEWQPDLVLHEETELAGAVAALQVDAGHVVHGLGLMTPVRIWDVFEPALRQLIKQSGGEAPVTAVRDALVLDVCPPTLQPPPGKQIWSRLLPLRHSAGSPAPGGQLELSLDALPYERTVHLTLGTVFTDAVDFLRTALEALRQLPVNVVVTVGPDGDPAAFGPQPAQVAIERYVPHSLLLPHCNVVVSHGGAGILFGALAHGLPQLVSPQGADQHINAEALTRAGAGLVLGGDDVTGAAVTRAVERLLDDPTFTSAASAVQAEIAAMPDADSVVRTLTTAHRNEPQQTR